MRRFLKKYYAITDRKQFEYDFEIQIKRYLHAGIRMIQLREKDVSPRQLFNLATKAKNILKGYDAILIINDRVDVAVMSGAAGVHIPSKGLPVVEIKRKFPNLIVGKSCHSINDALQAEEEGADYITFSPIFETPGKGKPQGLDKLKKVVETVKIPVYALGGISESNVQDVLNTGVYGIAGIRLFIK